MTTWLATVHVNRFGLQETQAADGTPIRVYYTAATPPADVDGYALAGEMLTWLEPLVGALPVRRLWQRRGGRSDPVLRAGDPGDVDLPARRGRRGDRRARAGASVVRQFRLDRQMGGSVARRRDRDLFRGALAQPRRSRRLRRGDARDLRLRRGQWHRTGGGRGAGRDVHRPDLPPRRRCSVRAAPGGRRPDVLPRSCDGSPRSIAVATPPRGTSSASRFW